MTHWQDDMCGGCQVCLSRIHAREILWLVINTERTYQDRILEKLLFYVNVKCIFLAHLVSHSDKVSFCD